MELNLLKFGVGTSLLKRTEGSGCKQERGHCSSLSALSSGRNRATQAKETSMRRSGIATPRLLQRRAGRIPDLHTTAALFLTHESQRTPLQYEQAGYGRVARKAFLLGFW